MKQIITDDGTVTFHNERVDENYHSKSGAVDESFKKYVEPCGVKDGFKILDACFGLGYNSLAALLSAKKLQITAVEIDGELFTHLAQIHFENPEWESKYAMMINQLIQNQRVGKTEFDCIVGDSIIKTYIDDIRVAIKKLPDNSFDTIFFDPFSPKKEPQLWTQELFADCFRILKKGGMLATYSYARVVRDNLKASGFDVKDGPIIGRRSPSTLAVKN